MLALTFAGVALVAASGLGAASVPVVFKPTGTVNFDDRTYMTFGEGGDDFCVRLRGTNACDTAWCMHSEKLAVPEGMGPFALEFEVYSDEDWDPIKVESNDQYGCYVAWFDEAGSVVKAEPWLDALGRRHASEKFSLALKKGSYGRFRVVGEVPRAARFVSVSFGTDAPNVRPGGRVGVRGTSFAVYPKGSPMPRQLSPDLDPPHVRSLLLVPSEDPATDVAFALDDDSEIDWSSVSVVWTKTKTPLAYERVDKTVVLRPQGGKWPSGDHHITVAAADVKGNRSTSYKAFRIGPKPDVPSVTLRKDGVTLVDGEPFFPIGLFAVCPREANLYSLERAFQDLKAAGVNFVHSYTHARTPEFLALCEKYGMKAWMAEYDAGKGSEWFETKGRNSPAVLSWYIGDDTTSHVQPGPFADRAEALAALDGCRITCHADVHSGRFGNYADLADVFMPEIYPVSGDAATDAKCVAKTIDAMERSKADIVANGNSGKPRAIWPIIQYFKGYGWWKRMPTPAEATAMTYASVIHGARGVTWYTYGGFVRPEKKKFDYGVTSSAEVWATTTNLTHQLSVLSPVLLSADVPQPAAPTVLSGPKEDACGRPSVSVLLRKLGDVSYLFAVNATDRPVRTRLSLGKSAVRLAVPFEGRSVSANGTSAEDDFAPFGVHIYRY